MIDGSKLLTCSMPTSLCLVEVVHPRDSLVMQEVQLEVALLLELAILPELAVLYRILGDLVGHLEAIKVHFFMLTMFVDCINAGHVSEGQMFERLKHSLSSDLFQLVDSSMDWFGYE